MGVVLGSGLGHVGDVLVDRGAIPLGFGEIPGFPVSSVSGHKGRLLFQAGSGKNIFVMQGRVHFYEGHEIDAIEFPVRVLAQLGMQQLVLTNAAGGVNKDLVPGNLMMLTDHLCFIPYQPVLRQSPSVDRVSPRVGERRVYCDELQFAAKAAAARLGINLKSGVYAAMPGPNYETPAEVRMLRTVGADAVGMSTVLEASAAAELGVRVLGISCITNSASGITGDPLCHSEVKETAGLVEADFANLILNLLQ
ncbi:UNVERIFIED_CONTAM: hypothetical protein GTU68_040228 [Idotea baltica]|nr:hypothetical protein [Idotea baltica]